MFSILQNGIYIDFTEDNRNCGFENQDLDLRFLVGFKHLNKMEAGRILDIFEESRVFVDNRSCNELMHWLDYVENVLIDDDKTVLFRNRLYTLIKIINLLKLIFV